VRVTSSCAWNCHFLLPSHSPQKYNNNLGRVGHSSYRFRLQCACTHQSRWMVMPLAADLSFERRQVSVFKIQANWSVISSWLSVGSTGTRQWSLTAIKRHWMQVGYAVCRLMRSKSGPVIQLKKNIRKINNPFTLRVLACFCNKINHVYNYLQNPIIGSWNIVETSFYLKNSIFDIDFRPCDLDLK